MERVGLFEGTELTLHTLDSEPPLLALVIGPVNRAMVIGPVNQTSGSERPSVWVVYLLEVAYEFGIHKLIRGK